MNSSSNWEKDVYKIFLKFLKSKKQKIKEIFNWEKIQKQNPFGTSFINNPNFWKACKIERSFVTTLGQSVYEDIALIISKNLYDNAAKGYTYINKIDKTINKKINQIIKELNEAKRTPDWDMEVKIIRESVNNKEKDLNELKITMDLYIPKFKNNMPLYAEIKSPKPNKDQCLQTKQKLFKVYFSEDWIGEHVYFAFPYNPYQTRKNYDHPHIKGIFKIPDSPKLLIGQEFWDLIGGEGTYFKLLEIAFKVGKEINILDDDDNEKDTQKTIMNFK